MIKCLVICEAVKAEIPYPCKFSQTVHHAITIFSQNYPILRRSVIIISDAGRASRPPVTFIVELSNVVWYTNWRRRPTLAKMITSHCEAVCRNNPLTLSDVCRPGTLPLVLDTTMIIVTTFLIYFPYSKALHRRCK